MLFSCRKYADTISSAYGLGDNCIHFLTRAFQRPVYRDEYEVFPGLLLLLSQSREALGTIFFRNICKTSPVFRTFSIC